MKLYVSWKYLLCFINAHTAFLLSTADKFTMNSVNVKYILFDKHIYEIDLIITNYHELNNNFSTFIAAKAAHKFIKIIETGYNITLTKSKWMII